MRLRLERQAEQGGMVQGRLLVDDQPFCATVEPPIGDGGNGYAIAPGDYVLKIGHRSESGRDFLLVTGVRDPRYQPQPGDMPSKRYRSGLLIQNGECADGAGHLTIGPIDAVIPFDVDASRDLADRLFRLVAPWTRSDGVRLQIIAAAAAPTAGSETAS